MRLRGERFEETSSRCFARPGSMPPATEGWTGESGVPLGRWFWTTNFTDGHEWIQVGLGDLGWGACGLLRLMMRMKAGSAWGLRFACEVGLGLGQRFWFDVFLTVAGEVF